MTVTLEAQTREVGVSRKELKAQGTIPAICYGNNIKAMSIAVPLIAFKKAWKESGESGTVVISVGGKNVETLIHDVQRDATSNEPLHVDFLAIDTSKVISVSVPLEFDGVSPAVKSGVGTLVKVMHEIEIEALPKDLPHAIHVDISSLVSQESQITVADLVFPVGVSATGEPTDVVATIEKERDEEPAEASTADLSSIEVEKKGKKEDEAAA
jgi:large subunit ribosomal protein L25